MSKPYKTSVLERSKIDNIVKELKSLGLITETNSSYSSPVLLVTKKDGEPRLGVDYRKFNQQTVKKNFSIANIDEILKEPAGANSAASEDAVFNCTYRVNNIVVLVIIIKVFDLCLFLTKVFKFFSGENFYTYTF